MGSLGPRRLTAQSELPKFRRSASAPVFVDDCKNGEDLTGWVDNKTGLSTVAPCDTCGRGQPKLQRSKSLGPRRLTAQSELPKFRRSASAPVFVECDDCKNGEDLTGWVDNKTGL